MVHSFVVGPCRIATLPAHITTHTRTHANTQQTFRLFSHISPFVGRSSNPPHIQPRDSAANRNYTGWKANNEKHRNDKKRRCVLIAFLWWVIYGCWIRLALSENIISSLCCVLSLFHFSRFCCCCWYSSVCSLSFHSSCVAIARHCCRIHCPRCPFDGTTHPNEYVNM